MNVVELTPSGQMVPYESPALRACAKESPGLSAPCLAVDLSDGRILLGERRCFDPDQFWTVPLSSRTGRQDLSDMAVDAGIHEIAVDLAWDVQHNDRLSAMTHKAEFKNTVRHYTHTDPELTHTLVH